MMLPALCSALLYSVGHAAVLDKLHLQEAFQSKPATSSSTTTPQYFQTSPKLWAGPTPTGEAPFLVQTNPAPFASVSYIPNQPLETQVPISGNRDNKNIFQLHGQLSHYFPNPDGFGVDEYPLPAGSNVTFVYMLSRHGSRYPTVGSGAPKLGEKLMKANSNSTLKATGDLAFLNTWQYKLGAEILVPVGKQEYDTIDKIRHPLSFIV
jgi:hypothetical protein